MNTRHLIATELLPGLELVPEIALRTDTLVEMRRLLDTTLVLDEEEYAHPEIEIEHLSIAHAFAGPDVKIIVYKPRNSIASIPACVSIHGGGYVAGTAAFSGPGNVRTAAEVGCMVVSVDYRLAPETRAPGAVEDCYSALKWLHENADELGVDRNRIAIGGESAGGGLAAALALLARDRGEFNICFQVLIYPMLDDRTAAGKNHNPHTGEFLWTSESNAFGWEALLGAKPGGANVSPYAAAARATDLSNLPPAYLSVGSLDLFLEENIDYATRMLRAGVNVELHVYPGAYHGYEMAAESLIAIQSEKERRDALIRAFTT
ncbi:MAG: alpha/beta hydrolase [Gammaproteobacteria bacterium]|nr:alpha/beta hydrolase [Gammaproteobacteria bacterium]